MTESTNSPIIRRIYRILAMPTPKFKESDESKSYFNMVFIRVCDVY